MVIVSYRYGADRDLQEKIKIAHGQTFYNGEVYNIINKILKNKLNLRINQINKPKPPYKTYFLEISSKPY